MCRWRAICRRICARSFRRLPPCATDRRMSRNRGHLYVGRSRVVDTLLFPANDMSVPSRSFAQALQFRRLSQRFYLRTIIGMLLAVILFRICFGLVALAASLQPAAPVPERQLSAELIGVW